MHARSQHSSISVDLIRCHVHAQIQSVVSVDEDAISQEGGARSTAIRTQGASLSRRAAVQQALSAIVCGGAMDTAIASTHNAEKQHERYSPNKPIHLLPIATLQQVAEIDLAQGNPGNELAIWLLSGMGVDCKTANTAKMRMPTKGLEQVREDPAFESIQKLYKVYQESLGRQVGSVCGGGHAPAFFAPTPLRGPLGPLRGPLGPLRGPLGPLRGPLGPLHFACACPTTHHPAPHTFSVSRRKTQARRSKPPLISSTTNCSDKQRPCW